VWRAGFLFVTLLVSAQAVAHSDGNIERLRHHYKVSSGQAYFSKTPEQACQDQCPNYSSRLYHAHWYDGATSVWKCQCKAVDGTSPGTIISFHSTQGNEVHCDYGFRFNGGTGGSCGLGGPANCFARAGENQSFISVSQPNGFNIPDDGSADGTLWEGLEQCSVKRISSTVNNGCFNVTYQITGSYSVDEDGLPVASSVGSTWPTGILSQCDPATGQPVSGGGWAGTGGGGGGGGFGDLIEEHDDTLADPLVSGNQQLEEDTDSWLDLLTEPVEWTDELFDAFNIDFALWSPLQNTCSPASAFSLSFDATQATEAFQVHLTCEDTAQLRQWLGVLCALAFFWWLLNTALSMPKTGG